MKLNDAILGSVFLVLALLVFWQAQTVPQLANQPFGAGTFPMIIAAMMGTGGLVLILSGAKTRAGGLVTLAPWLTSRGGLVRVLSVPVVVAVYALLSDFIGFPLLVPPLLASQLWITTRRPLLSVLVALAATGVIWLVFARILLVPLPLGLLNEVIY